ncbi:MAG: HIT family protein [Halomonadaceae bacterium]|nr:MAG: HIT family protein [Halomonadaceae bacterium]
MTACIFCQICAGTLPASVVYEDKQVMAFMDIHPLGRGHVIVIPRHHARQLPELPPGLADYLFVVARHILKAQRALGWGLEGSHILLNDGPQANQTVAHVHVHIIPREKRDSLPSLGRLLMHVTGLYGPVVKRQRLDQQAQALAAQLARLPLLTAPELPAA